MNSAKDELKNKRLQTKTEEEQKAKVKFFSKIKKQE
jgi:hypothetical protein